MTANNDSDDLEALFDSIAADFQPATPAPAAAAKPAPAAAPEPAPVAPAPARPAAKSGVDQLGDSDDLQALFDSVVAETRQETVATPAPAPAAPGPAPAAAPVPNAGAAAASDDDSQERVFNRIGHMARALHDTLGELGYDKLIEQTVSAIPDAKDRLAYVANLTEQAACRVLNATDIASPVVDELGSSAKSYGERWNKAFANQLSTAEFKQLAEDTRGFFNEQMPAKVALTHAQLTEIMMAQDFQDLTGQVIKKIVALAQTLESGLMNVLIDIVPETKRTEEVNSLMNGPVINVEGRSDVVVNQEQVDELLDSLGF